MTNSSKKAPISIDQAAALLGRLPKIPVEPAGEMRGEFEAGEPADAGSPSLEDGAGTPTEDNEKPGGDGDAEDEGSEPAELKPPKFWDAKAKERFGALPRDVQEIVLAKEDERNAATARALQETAEKRKAAEAETQKINQLLGGLGRVLPEAAMAFQQRWANVDWNKLADQHGADAALNARNRLETERQQLQQLQAAKNVLDRAAHDHYVKSQMAELAALWPELSDSKSGAGRRAQLPNI